MAEKMSAAAESNNHRHHQDSSATAGEEMTELLFSKRGCCSFWVPCFESNNRSSSAAETTTTSSGSWWEKINRAAEINEEKWWAKGWTSLKKVREWSEIAAGPKWKTFIRRFNNKGGGGGVGGKSGKYQYDPMSYSLNFDEGPGQNGLLEDDFVYRDFSSRYAVNSMSTKTSVDLGKDGPNFL